MNNLNVYFSKFVNILMKIFLIPLCVVILGNAVNYSRYVGKYTIIIALIYIISAYFFYFLYKKNISTKKIFFFILLYGLALRIAWVILVPTYPVSDFLGMYNAGEKILTGDTSMFKGTAYFARFSHMAMTVLFYTVIRFFFGEPLIPIKIFNVLSSITTIYICYLIGKELFKSEGKALISGFLAAIFPAFISYSSVVCSENIAMPFFLLSIYFFVKVINDSKPLYYLIFSGICLSIGNLFRMVAAVMIIAYSMYIILYLQKTLINKTKAMGYVLISFAIPLVLISFSLKAFNITEYNLWSGSESKWTSILKGTNMDHLGAWNLEDAEIPDKYNNDYDKVEKACKEIVFERLTQTSLPKVISFYAKKYSSEWMEGAFAGTYWARVSLEATSFGYKLAGDFSVVSDFTYFLLMLYVCIGLFNKKQYLKNKPINLLYIMLFGYICFYLIIERQNRYPFIISWLFIFLPLTVTFKTKKNYKNKIL